MPDATDYHALIDQLLTYETTNELISRFQEEDSLLTEKLLQVLADRLSEAEDEDKPHLSWLIEWVTRLYGYKCLNIFIRLPFEEAVQYAEPHIDSLVTHANYDYLDFLIVQCNDQSKSEQNLKAYQGLLAGMAGRVSLFRADWQERRKIFLRGFTWLIHPATTNWLISFSEDYPEYRELVEPVNTLISHCLHEGVESVVKAIDIDWLVSKAKESEEDEKIGYLEQVIDLLSDEPNQRWAALLVNLGNAYSQRIPGDRAENLELAITAYERALQVRTRQDMPYEWAATQNNLGNTYSQRIRGDRAENLESAIAAYEQALQVRTRQDMLYEWAVTQNNLGSVYRERIRGNRTENLESAIMACEQVLQVRTRQDMPCEWAGTQNNLGNAYLGRIRGDRAENLESAILAYKAALQVYTLQDMPNEWAGTQSNLGVAYSKRIHGDRVENLESAITAYEKALQVYTLQDMLFDWAEVQNNLGDAYRERIRGNNAENLESAIIAYEHALEVYTRKDTPYQWAATQNNLGTAYSKCIRGDRAANLESAIKAYEYALEVYTQQNMPYKWAMIQNNLGTAYRDRICGDRAENLESAITAHKQALSVHTRRDRPHDWAMSQNNLGNAYSQRIRGDRAENLESAIDTYKHALQVYTRQEMPYDWAMSQNNVGIAYSQRIRGDRAENQESAIRAYEHSLEVYTQQNMPYEWAGTQNNLGTVYRDRTRGDRGENLESAIRAYEHALEVYTLQGMPYEWAATQNNLGVAYSDRIRGDRAENLESAITAYEEALQVRTRQDMPYDWAMTQNNLGTVYRERIRGNPAENLELAIKAHEHALQVYTRHDMPYEWAKTRSNQGSAYSQRIRGNPSENLESAIQAYKEALQVSTKETVPVGCRLISLNLGDLLYKAQRWASAREAYQQAHEALELMLGEALHEESRSKIADENAMLYARLIYCCLILDDLEGAVNYALAGKSRTLTEQLAGDRKTLTDLLEENPALEQQYAPIEKLRRELDELLALRILPPAEGDTRSTEELKLEESNRDTYENVLRQEINKLINNLVFSYPALSAITPLPTITRADAQALAGRLGKTPLVEYIRHTGGLGAFVITAEAVHYVPLEDGLVAPLGESLESLWNHSTNGSTLFWRLPDSRKRLHDLYRAIFKPLIPFLPPSGEIVIAPTHALHLVPFQALLTELGTFLSESYAFTFVPSLASLRVLNERQQRFRLTEPVPDRLLSVSHSGGGENYLKNVSLEALNVGKQFADAVSLSEEEATLERVIAEANRQSYRVVHLSCHGSFLPDNPTHSGLLLAQQDMLTVNDIRVRIRLKGRPLVTLSACQTGQTPPKQGDETTGISWAFLAAGASSVVASQWKVPDDSTRELFSHFYQLRRESNLSDAEALRQAMMKVREIGAYTNRPEYWAGFQVMGLPVP